MLASAAMPPGAPPDRLHAAQVLREEALRDGFTRVGIARAAEPARFERFVRWIAAGRHAGMRYLADTRALRQSPEALLPGARSVVCLAAPYSAAPYVGPDGSRLARYARGPDYHGTLRERALEVVARSRRRLPGAWDTRVCVDSTPIAERSFAAAAGLGWIGKNGCLIDPEHGSYLLLAEIVTDLDLPPDEPVAEQCGACVRCLDACPTEAFVAPGLLDAARCLAYWTIEHHGADPRRVEGRRRRPRLRLRRLPGGLPLERSRSRFGRRGAGRSDARRDARHGQGRLAPALRKDRRQPRRAPRTPAQRRRLGRSQRGCGLPARSPERRRPAGAGALRRRALGLARLEGRPL